MGKMCWPNFKLGFMCPVLVVFRHFWRFFVIFDDFSSFPTTHPGGGPFLEKNCLKNRVTEGSGPLRFWPPFSSILDNFSSILDNFRRFCRFSSFLTIFVISDHPPRGGSFFWENCLKNRVTEGSGPLRFWTTFRRFWTRFVDFGQTPPSAGRTPHFLEDRLLYLRHGPGFGQSWPRQEFLVLESILNSLFDAH